MLKEMHIGIRASPSLEQNYEIACFIECVISENKLWPADHKGDSEIKQMYWFLCV